MTTPAGDRSRRPALVAVGLLAVLAALLAATTCSRRTPAERALAATEENLGKIRSGRLAMAVLASSPGAPEGRGVGFEMRGPFAVGQEEGSLPVADLEYTRVTGAQRRTTRFVSTGTRAFVEVDGEVQELGEDQLAEMRVRGGGGDRGLEGLSLGMWLDEPRIGPGPPLDGVATERVEGRADPVATLNDLAAIAAQFGLAEDASLPTLEGEAAAQVRRATTSSSVDVLTGVEDRLLRHLELAIDLAPAGAGEELRAALGDLAGTRLRFSLDVAAVNQPVAVDPPMG